MANYLEKYNYQPVNAFQTDYAGILKGLEVKEAYWKQGVQRVKSAYEQAAGLSLTGEPAKNKLKNFMEAADGQLKKALATDVSMYDNAASAISIYSPLYKDKDLMDNHSNTEFYQNQFSEINRMRTQEGGKYYNEANHLYVQNAYKDFEQGVSQGKSASDYIGKQKAYTPYYDYRAEYNDVLSKCKPDSVESTTINGLYINTLENSSQSKENLLGCLKTSLSSKAYNQMTIEGAVQYRGRIKELATSYETTILDDNKTYAKQIIEIALEKKKAKAAGVLTKDLDTEYTNYTSQLNNKIAENNTLYTKIRQGDYSEVENNFEHFAGTFYAQQKMDDFATAQAYKKIKEQIDADPVGMMKAKMDNDNAHFNTEMAWNKYKFGQEQALKEKELQQNFLKSFMNDSGSGSSSGSFNSWLSMLKVGGIDIADYIQVGLDEGNNVTEGLTLEGVKEQLDADHKERVIIGDGIYNTLTSLVGDKNKDNLDKILRLPNGKIGLSNAADYAQMVIDNFYKPVPKQDGTIPKLKNSEVEELQRQVNAYTNQSSKVWNYMDIVKKANEAIAKDPEGQKRLNINNEEIRTTIKKLASNPNTSLFDPSIGKYVHPTEEDLLRIANGNHNIYALKDGKFINKFSNTEVSPSLGLTELSSKGFVVGRNPLSFIDLISERSKLQNGIVNGVLKEVTKNKVTYGIGSVPKISDYLKNLVSSVPELNQKGVTARPIGNAYQGSDRNWYQDTKFYSVDPDTKLETVLNDTDQAVTRMLKDSKSITQGGSFSNIMSSNKGTVVLKVNDLINLLVGEESEMKESVDNNLKRFDGVVLQNQKRQSFQVKTVSGGFKLGVDIVGTGRGNNTYQIYVIDPSGEKHLGNKTADKNQVSNLLQSVEQEIKQY